MANRPLGSSPKSKLTGFFRRRFSVVCIIPVSLRDVQYVTVHLPQSSGKSKKIKSETCRIRTRACCM